MGQDSNPESNAGLLGKEGVQRPHLGRLVEWLMHNTTGLGRAAKLISSVKRADRRDLARTAF